MRIPALIGLLIICAFPSSANAALTFYSDRPSWETALGGLISTENFDSVTPFILSDGINNAGLIDIELSNLLGNFNEIDDGSEFSAINGTPHFQGGASGSGAELITINLPWYVLGFAADWTTTHSAGGLTIEIDSIQAEFSDEIPSGNGTGFLGVISTNPFNQIKLFDDSQNETFGVDNVSFGSEVVVPLPATAWLFLSGLSLLSFRTKQHK